MMPAGTHIHKDIPISQYISEKIDMLSREFYIELTDEDIRHFIELKTEPAVDAFAHKLLVDRL